MDEWMNKWMDGCGGHDEWCFYDGYDVGYSDSIQKKEEWYKKY